MNSNTLENGLADAAVVDLLEGGRIGDHDGVVICDGCSARLRLGTEEEKAERISMSGYASTPRNRAQPWKLSYVYCPECDATHGSLGTRDVDEAAIEFDAVFKPKTRGSLPVVSDVSITERSRSEQLSAE